MTASAWDAVRAYPVFAAVQNEQVDALRAAGVAVTVSDGAPVDALLAAVGPDGAAVWLGGPSGDEQLARELGMRLLREPGRADLELMYGSWDPPGARLLDAVSVLDTLLSPGGDPWLRELVALSHPGQQAVSGGQQAVPGEPKASAWDLPVQPGGQGLPGDPQLLAGGLPAQPPGRGLSGGQRPAPAAAETPRRDSRTHQPLARYLIEECYEAFDAISSGDLGALREELGDLLLQVMLHARLAEELPEGERWSVDDVAAGLVEKMIRRNPHVFGDTTVGGVEDIIENWEQIKQEEKARESVMDGIALAQPALALAAKVLSRARRGGISPPAEAVPAAPVPAAALADDSALGAALFAMVAEASDRGLDAEAALRRAALAYADRVRTAERSANG